MSWSFWGNMFLAILILITASLLVYQFKHGRIRDFRARRLRLKLLPRLDTLLNGLASEHNGALQNNFSLMRARSEVELLVSQASVLFAEERIALARFMAMLSAYSAKQQSGLAISSDLEEVLLVGQRTLADMAEIAA